MILVGVSVLVAVIVANWTRLPKSNDPPAVLVKLLNAIGNLPFQIGYLFAVVYSLADVDLIIFNRYIKTILIGNSRSECSGGGGVIRTERFGEATGEKSCRFPADKSMDFTGVGSGPTGLRHLLCRFRRANNQNPRGIEIFKPAQENQQQIRCQLAEWCSH